MKRQVLTVCFALGSAVVSAQTRTSPPPSSAQAQQLATGWAAFLQHKDAEAIQQAAIALQQNPRNTDAVSLLLQATISQGGPAAGLAVYEGWLAQRRLDEAHVLRHVALAELKLQARETSPPNIRREAFLALAAEGDPQALIDIDRNYRGGGFAETQILASLGSDDATRKLVAQLGTTPGSKSQVITALAGSHNKLAVAPLASLLKDVNPDTRAAAAQALGELGYPEAVAPLKTLIEGQPFYVQLLASGALFKLHDTSGLAFLRKLEADVEPGVRLSALRLTVVEPDETWLRNMRTLAQDPDPDIRRQAADLIAPFDPETSKAVLLGLLNDANIAIREDAARILVEKVESDFASLRRYLHSADPMDRIRAANRILVLTR